MYKVLMSAIVASGMLAIASTASAADLLEDRQLDVITAGADITTSQLATAVAAFDIQTNADHDVTATANAYTSTTVAVVYDASAVGNSTSQSSLDTSTVN